MKLSKTATAGFALLLIASIGFSISTIFFQASARYVHMKVDRSKLAGIDVYFRSLSLISKSQSTFGRVKVSLTPYVEVTGGPPPSEYSTILSEHSVSTYFSGGRPLSSYVVTKIQITRLLAIPGVAYFILSPEVYPQDVRFIAYKITPYNINNQPIIISADYLRFNPCPPARGYTEQL
jgi:hypothetical protein